MSSEVKCKRRRTICEKNEVGSVEEEGYTLKKRVLEASKAKEKTITLYPTIFKDDSLTYGGGVKARSEVVKEHSKGSRMPPNMSCRIESFGRICGKFDDRRKRWVYEMGFSGLLHLSYDMQLPRQLAYWVMTRIDPISKMFITPDGVEFRFSKKQV